MGESKRNPDHSWWIDQINSGIYYRRNVAYQPMWTRWRQCYRGEWTPGILPVNIFFTMLRTLVPRVYFKNPAMSISPAMPGLLNAIFAQILERIDNKLMIQMKIKKHMKKMIQDAFLFGTGWGKLGFGAQFTPSPNIAFTAAPAGARWGTVEYRTGVMPNMPWFARVHPKHMIVPNGCADLDDARWTAHEVERPLQDVKDDPRLSNTRDLVPTKSLKVESGSTRFNVSKPIEMITLYELRDSKFGQVSVFSPDHDKILHNGADDLQTAEGFPNFELVFNPDDEVMWGVPDSVIIEPQQLEINEIRTQIMKHRRATIVKLLYGEQALDPEDVAKMTDEDVQAAIKVKDINQILPMKMSSIPEELFAAEEMVRSDVREQIGFSRNQFGERLRQSGDTTATEASIVQMASEIRVDERQDIAAEVLTRIMRATHEIIFKFWNEDQVIDLVGPGGIPIWIEYTGKMLSGGAYEVNVEPDTAIPQTRNARMQLALQGYQLFRDNPLVDPIALTRYTLREFYGFKYEDLMQGLPQGAGQMVPMNIEQYAQLMGNARGMGLPMLPQKGGGQGAGTP